MGFDLIGKKPSSDEGKYFENNVCWWHPLANYCIGVAPEITANCALWETNDGDGLKQQDALALADLLQDEVDSGRCKIFADEYEATRQALPKVPCWFCEGTGKRKPVPESGAGNEITGIRCNGCEGSGSMEDWESHFPFSVDNVPEFISFLRGCGGFEIW